MILSDLIQATYEKAHDMSDRSFPASISAVGMANTVAPVISYPNLILFSQPDNVLSARSVRSPIYIWPTCQHPATTTRTLPLLL